MNLLRKQDKWGHNGAGGSVILWSLALDLLVHLKSG